jgi:hypothetical protein
MDQQGRRRLVKFIADLEQALADAEATEGNVRAECNACEVALMQRDLADLRRLAVRLGVRAPGSPRPRDRG